MIQRVQSILLLLAALVFVATVFFQSVIATASMVWVVPTVLGVNIVVAVVAILAIFMFSDRKQQLKIVTILQFLALFAIVAVLAGIYLSGAINQLSGNVMAIILLVLPLVGYVLIRLAGSRIKKDIELIRSVDRLRP